MIKIIVDTREPTRNIKAIMDKLLLGDRFKDFTVIYKKLDYGDFYIENGDQNINIQRKAINDYTTSYGGLPDQFLHLRMGAQRQALLIEGKYTTKYGKSQMWVDRGSGPVEAMRIQTSVRMLSRLQDDGAWIFYTNNLFETLVTILYIGEYLPMLETKGSSGKLDIDDILLAVPGIGRETLSSLKANYDTPYEALRNIDMWAKKRIKDGLESW